MIRPPPAGRRVRAGVAAARPSAPPAAPVPALLTALRTLATALRRSLGTALGRTLGTALRRTLGAALRAAMATATVVVLAPSPAQAQGAQSGATSGFPNKPVRVIIPYPPGGSGELFARPIAKRLTDVWGQNVLLDFRSGAGGTIASELLVQAAPDGYTLLVVLAAHAINPSLYPKLAYDTIKDFAPVTMAATLPLILETHPDVPAKTVAELIDYARKNPKALNFASAGNGNTSHLTGELFKTAAKVQMQHVPYKGSGPAIVALVGGEVQL